MKKYQIGENVQVKVLSRYQGYVGRINKIETTVSSKGIPIDIYFLTSIPNIGFTSQTLINN